MILIYLLGNNILGLFMEISEIKKILHKGDNESKLNILCYLSDLFESYIEKIDNFSEIIYELISFALNENDEELKDEAFYALSTAASNNDISQVDIGMLVDNLHMLTVDNLLVAIDIISFTHNERYITLLNQYANHSDKRVAYSANIGISEIKKHFEEKEK